MMAVLSSAPDDGKYVMYRYLVAGPRSELTAEMLKIITAVNRMSSDY
jgi:hypothetical protein